MSALSEPRAIDLDRVMAAHGDAVLKLAFSYVRDRAGAEDIYQETFLRWLRHGAGVNPASVKPWLLSVAANLGRDHLRSWAHRNLRFNEIVPEPVASDEPGDPVIAADDARRLAAAVMDLPVPFREVMHLRYYDQLDTNEIASILEVPVATVRSRLLRARRQLRARLLEEHDDA